MPVRSASFVALLLDARAVREDGLPQAAFFLWNDDFEYTTRLLRHRRGVACAASVVEHRTKVFGGADADPGERFVLEVRNKLWTFTRSRPLGAKDTVLYGGATARRWVRTLARSQRRDVLLRGLADGLRQGLGRPAPTATVLAGLGEVSDDVRAVEAAAGRAPLAPAGPTTELPPFSVLLPVWARDDVAQLRRALDSVTLDQELRPDEVLVVRDGPVPADLQRALDDLAERPDVRVLELPANVGLARALEEGLQRTTFDVVARMDADDVSLPGRFAAQLPLIAAGPTSSARGCWRSAPTRTTSSPAAPRRRAPPRSPGTPASTTRSTTRRSSTGARPWRPRAATGTWTSWRTTGSSRA